MSTRVLIVDDHEGIAEALEWALKDSGYEVSHTPSESLSLEGVLGLARSFAPHVALVDLHLGRNGSGLAMMQPLSELGVRVVALTARADDLARAESVAAGACGFLTKLEPLQSIVDYVGRVARGERVISAGQAYELQDMARRKPVDRRRQRFEQLSPREQEVLGALMQGHNANTIAEANGVAVGTVRKQIEGVREKLGVPSQLAAVALAREVGWPDN